jgi:hypothetical protein
MTLSRADFGRVHLSWLLVVDFALLIPRSLRLSSISGPHVSFIVRAASSGVSHLFFYIPLTLMCCLVAIQYSASLIVVLFAP